MRIFPRRMVFSAKPLIGDKIVVEVNDMRGIEDIMKEVEKRFQLY